MATCARVLWAGAKGLIDVSCLAVGVEQGGEERGMRYRQTSERERDQPMQTQCPDAACKGGGGRVHKASTMQDVEFV